MYIGRTKEGKITVSVSILVKIITGTFTNKCLTYNKNFGKYVEETFCERLGSSQKYEQLLADIKQKFGTEFVDLYKKIEGELLMRYPDTELASTITKESPDSTYLIYAKADLYDKKNDMIIEYKIYSATRAKSVLRPRYFNGLRWMTDLQCFLYTYMYRKPVRLCEFIVDYDRRAITHISEQEYEYYPEVELLIPPGSIIEYYYRRVLLQTLL